MTTSFKKVMEEFIKCHGNGTELDRELIAAYKEQVFKIGDLVAIENMGVLGRPGRVVAMRPEVEVMWPDACLGQYYASGLTKVPLVPLELPKDHIDRFWIVGAWLYHNKNQFWIVGPNEEGLRPYCSGAITDKTKLPSTGWSFHPNSPIQKENEL